MAKSDLQEGTITNTGTVQKDGTIKPFPSFTTADKLPKEKQEKLDAVMKDYDDNVTVVEVTKKEEHKPLSWDEEQLILLRASCAPTATDPEFKKLLYLSQTWQLDPMLREIWLVKFGSSPAQIYAGRDGFLKIAHRSGHFDGMRSGVKKNEDGEIVGWCEVWRTDMTHSFYGEVLLSEYSTGQNLWKTKPMVMIQKVAESVVLRKSFSVCGIYSPDEMGD